MRAYKAKGELVTCEACENTSDPDWCEYSVVKIYSGAGTFDVYDGGSASFYDQDDACYTDIYECPYCERRFEDMPEIQQNWKCGVCNVSFTSSDEAAKCCS
jgi:ribosomal protein L37AE/L43A